MRSFARLAGEHALDDVSHFAQPDQYEVLGTFTYKYRRWHLKPQLGTPKPGSGGPSHLLSTSLRRVCLSPCHTRDTHGDLTKEPKVCSTAAIVRDFLENRLDMEK